MAAMTRKPRGLTNQMEQLIESALAPGSFISYNANYDFVSDLEAVEKQIAEPGFDRAADRRLALRDLPRRLQRESGGDRRLDRQPGPVR